MDIDNSTIRQATTPEPDQRSAWVLHIDGASNVQDSGAGLILIDFEGIVTEYAL